MVDQNQNENQPTSEPARKASEPKPLDRLIERLPVPPRYRTRKWFFAGVGAALLLLGALYQTCDTRGAVSQETVDIPPAIPTATPEPTAIPREEYRLPKQYAFVHFVNEMAACYDQNGQPASLETVEADIMQDVPTAVGTLLRLYADDVCEEVEPWHQIPGRAGWMLRASGVNEHLPELLAEQPEGEEPK